VSIEPFGLPFPFNIDIIVGGFFHGCSLVGNEDCFIYNLRWKRLSKKDKRKTPKSFN
jgi:hypothetical protein